MAFPAGWKHRLAVKIKKDEVDADLSDFTLVLHDSFDDVFSQVNGPLDADGTRPSLDGGGDVRFSADEDGKTRLAVDVRTWKTDDDPSEGELEVAVMIPEVSEEEDTTVYMWWGKEGETQPDADEDYGQHDAYDDNYAGVYPLHDANDRTANGHHLSAVNSPTLNAEGLIGGCFESDGDSRYLVRTEAVVAPGDMTISGLFRATNTSSAQELAAIGDSASSGRTWRCNLGSSTNTGTTQAVKQSGTTNRFSSGNAYTANSWHHAAVRLGNSDCQSFLNGSGDTNNTSALTPTPTNRTTIGVVLYNGSPFAPMVGKIDEVRFSNVLRSVEWINAEHKNLLKPGDFFEFGELEDVEAPDVIIELPVLHVAI